MFDWIHADPSHRRLLRAVDLAGLGLLALAIPSFLVRPALSPVPWGLAAMVSFDAAVLLYVAFRLGCRFHLDGGAGTSLTRPRALVDLLLLAVGISFLSRLVARPMSPAAWGQTAWKTSWWTAFFVFVRAAQLVPFLDRLRRYRVHRDWLRSRPPLLVSVSFLVVIASGTLLLASPQATAKGVPAMGFVDALFTATSAVCVTGLVVNDPGTDLSILGQILVLSLIQIGGIGIVSLATFFFVGSGKEMVLGEEEAVLGGLDPRGRKSAVGTVRIVVLWTVAIELVGAVFLYFSWWDAYGSFSETAWQSLFHSVSAFCNAGFSLHPDSLVRFQGNPGVMLTVSALVILGGLGFVVLANLVEWFEARRSRERRYALHLHSQLVLRMTGFLLAVGTVAFLAFERQGALAGAGPLEALSQSFFLSVTARTAGFDSLGIGELTNASILVLLGLMFIGGSPGGTAGGIKTTTAAIFYLALHSMIQGRDQPIVARRTIRKIDLHRAVAVAVIGLLLLFVFLLALLATESGRGFDFRVIVFEATSAFGTVGLSLGLTPHLTVPGRVVVAALMFVGRVGPLTLATAVAREAKTTRVEYPEDPVSVG